MKSGQARPPVKVSTLPRATSMASDQRRSAIAAFGRWQRQWSTASRPPTVRPSTRARTAAR